MRPSWSRRLKRRSPRCRLLLTKKYQPKAAPKADTDAVPTEENTARQTRAAARAKLDIAVEDDDE